MSRDLHPVSVDILHTHLDNLLHGLFDIKENLDLNDMQTVKQCRAHLSTIIANTGFTSSEVTRLRNTTMDYIMMLNTIPLHLVIEYNDLPVLKRRDPARLVPMDDMPKIKICTEHLPNKTK